MNIFLILLGCSLYYISTRLLGSLFLNIRGISIDSYNDGWMHYVLWIPVLAELCILFAGVAMPVLIAVDVIKAGFKGINNKIEKFAKVIRTRLKLT